MVERYESRHASLQRYALDTLSSGPVAAVPIVKSPAGFVFCQQVPPVKNIYKTSREHVKEECDSD